MGAYGSPELYPKEPQKPYSPYTQYPQYPYKPKSHGFAFFFGGFLVGAVIVMVFTYSGKTSPSGKTIPTQAIPSASLYPSQAIPSSSPVISSVVPETIESQEYLKNWTKTAVVKALLYPESAQFSDSDSDWSISRDGTICTVTSYVIAKDKNKTVGRSPFVVKLQYDDLNAQITFVQIGNHVSYDITK